MSKKGIFSRFRRIFYEKIPFWLIKGFIFLQKLKVNKIWDHQFVARPMKSLYTKNQLIPTIRLWLLFFSGEKVVPKSQRENRKKSQFFGQKSANFQNFSKIIWNLIKHIEIHIWFKFQLNWTFFRQIMAIFNSNFALFYIYNFIYKMYFGRYEDVHVSGHNLRIEHPMNLSYGLLDCPWKGLYDGVENKPFWRKWLYLLPSPRALSCKSVLA